MTDCLMCGGRLSHSAQWDPHCCCWPCWKDLSGRLGRTPRLAEVAAMLLWDYWPIWEHYRGRAAA